MISKPFDPDTWSVPSPDLTLPENTVHLFRLRLDRQFLAPLRSTLGVSEAVHAERIPTVMDRRRFISGCGQLREILGRYLGMSAAEVPLGYGLSGEPLTIRSAHNLFFDWARSGGLGLVAVSRLHNVAVELEAVCGSIPFEILADHFFEPRENWDIRTSPKPEQSQRFFKTWTGREALRRAGESKSSVRELVPDEGFAAAVAAEGEDWQVAYWEW
jgi:4'-phosphopantetheinyl transferase